MIKQLAETFREALLNNDGERAKEVFLDASSHVDRETLINQLIVETLIQIGDQWDKGHLSLAEVYLSSKICESIALDLSLSGQRFDQNKLKIGLVSLIDQHSLGRQIVHATLVASGFELVDYGAGLSPENVVDVAFRDHLDVLLISVLMFPTALRVKEVRELVTDRGLSLKLLVGGAPFNLDQTLWNEVGADAMGKTPGEAIEILKLWNQESDTWAIK